MLLGLDTTDNFASDAIGVGHAALLGALGTGEGLKDTRTLLILNYTFIHLRLSCRLDLSPYSGL